MNNSYLYHYGVPGMKWGIRKKNTRYIDFMDSKYSDIDKNQIKGVKNVIENAIQK